MSSVPHTVAATESLSSLSFCFYARCLTRRRCRTPPSSRHASSLSCSCTNEDDDQSFKFRPRTDAYDGFRPYDDIRRVLCRERMYVHGDHNADSMAFHCETGFRGRMVRARQAGWCVRSVGAVSVVSEQEEALETELASYALIICVSYPQLWTVCRRKGDEFQKRRCVGYGGGNALKTSGLHMYESKFALGT